MNGNERLLP
ncbi:Protein of unknown function [Propionibacterium freudenreichii]|nr:Protein of unknown function [Propionibacterium freudenreichii]